MFPETIRFDIFLLFGENTRFWKRLVLVLFLVFFMYYY